MVFKMNMEHKDIYELIDEYVFGTLSDAENIAVEKHLDSNCPECLAKLRQVGEVSVVLANGITQTAPPDSLKKTLMHEIKKTVVLPLSTQKQGSSTSSKIFAVLGAVAVVALIVWNGSLNTKLIELQSQLINSSEKLDRLIADNVVQNEATLLLGKPCTKLVDLQGVSPNQQASAKIFLHPDEDYGVLYAYQLPLAPSDKEYRVWLKHDGIIQSVGVFTVQDDGSALLEVRGLPKVPTIDSFMVTIEPISGVKIPTGMTYLKGQNPLSTLH